MSDRSKGNGSIQQRSPGSWRLRYNGPPEPDGRRKQITETVRGTKKDAERVLRERLSAIETGGFVPRQKETVGEFMTRWLDTYAATNTSLKTQQGYRNNIKRYVLPSLGRIPLQALTGRNIQNLYSSMLKKGLSATAVVQVHRILRQALSHGVKWGLLTRNVADATTPPRIERKEMAVWDEDTTQQFIAAASESRFGEFYQLALLTGMRRSELAGLQWASVNFATGRLSVVKTLQRISGHGLVEGQPKTARSRRSIALSPDAVALLHEIRGRQIAQQIALGEVWQDTGFVFTKADGRQVDPDMISKDFPKVVEAAGLPHLTLHGLRHAHATTLLEEGFNPKVVSERLGHATIATTMEVYSHVLPGLQDEVALAIDAKLGRKPM